MTTSEQITDLAKAMSLFHSNIGKIKKDSTNPHFKNRYASLSAILETIKAPLAAAGLTFCQLPDDNDTLTTVLIHIETGQYIQSSYALNAQKRDPQGIGSAITYARRYALSAILALDVDDDDGQAATDPYTLTYATGQQVKELIAKAPNLKSLGDLHKNNLATVEREALKDAFTKRKEELTPKPEAEPTA